ncbi:MAG: hypothetical protein FRX49_10314 [Trebouxia sp. A1-2]|nr:MAG: hypothetical protein FRX49_10314 [Trebouxia sp. A1-2]
MKDSGLELTLSLLKHAPPAHRSFASHQIVCRDGRAGKNLCVAPLTGAMVQHLEEGLDGGTFIPEADRVARAVFTLRKLKRHMAWLLVKDANSAKNEKDFTNYRIAASS